MKVLVLSSLLFSASAFLAPQRPSYSSAVFSADVSDVEVSDVDVKLSVDEAKAELLSVAKDLKDEFGVLLIDSKAKESFKAAVEKLESVAEAPSDANLLVGEWTLVVSSSSSPASEKLTIDTSKIPFLKEGPVKDIQNTLNDSIEVVQSIKFGEESNSVDSIDHIIDYKPPSQLSSFVKNLPDAIRDLDINPVSITVSLYRIFFLNIFCCTKARDATDCNKITATNGRQLLHAHSTAKSQRDKGRFEAQGRS